MLAVHRKGLAFADRAVRQAAGGRTGRSSTSALADSVLSRSVDDRDRAALHYTRFKQRQREITIGEARKRRWAKDQRKEGKLFPGLRKARERERVGHDTPGTRAVIDIAVSMSPAAVAHSRARKAQAEAVLGQLGALTSASGLSSSASAPTLSSPKHPSGLPHLATDTAKMRAQREWTRNRLASRRRREFAEDKETAESQLRGAPLIRPVPDAVRRAARAARAAAEADAAMLHSSSSRPVLLGAPEMSTADVCRTLREAKARVRGEYLGAATTSSEGGDTGADGHRRGTEAHGGRGRRAGDPDMFDGAEDPEVLRMLGVTTLGVHSSQRLQAIEARALAGLRRETGKMGPLSRVRKRHGGRRASTPIEISTSSKTGALLDNLDAVRVKVETEAAEKEDRLRRKERARIAQLCREGASATSATLQAQREAREARSTKRRGERDPAARKRDLERGEADENGSEMSWGAVVAGDVSGADAVEAEAKAVFESLAPPRPTSPSSQISDLETEMRQAAAENLKIVDKSMSAQREAAKPRRRRKRSTSAPETHVEGLDPPLKPTETSGTAKTGASGAARLKTPPEVRELRRLKAVPLDTIVREAVEGDNEDAKRLLRSRLKQVLETEIRTHTREYVFPNWLRQRDDFKTIFDGGEAHIVAMALQTEPSKRELFHQTALVKWLRRFRIFHTLSDAKLGQLSRVLHLEEHPKGKVVCRQGEPGFVFYVILAGTVRIVVNGSDVGVLESGNAFGEQALIENSVRTATVVADTPVRLLALEKRAYDALLKGQQQAETFALAKFLRRVVLFESWTRTRMLQLCRVLHPIIYRAGDVVVRQGTDADNFYVLRRGVLQVVRERRSYKTNRWPVGAREWETRKALVLESTYSEEIRPGDYFGEGAVLTGLPRAATVVAKTKCEVLALHRNNFQLLSQSSSTMAILRRAARVYEGDAQRVAALREEREEAARERRRALGVVRRQSIHEHEQDQRQGSEATEPVHPLEEPAESTPSPPQPTKRTVTFQDSHQVFGDDR